MINAAVTDGNLRDQAIHAKVLLCAIIDSLAKSRFPNISSNGARFTQTVDECAEWPDSDRISLLHLKRALEVALTVPSEFSNLENWAGSAMQEGTACGTGDGLRDGLRDAACGTRGLRDVP